MQFRIDPLERRLITTAAERAGEPVSELIRRAIRREIEAPPRGQVNLIIDPRLATELLDKAARMGRTSAELVEALIRDHLDDLSDERIDPESLADWARRRAKELLSQ